MDENSSSGLQGFGEGDDDDFVAPNTWSRKPLQRTSSLASVSFDSEDFKAIVLEAQLEAQQKTEKANKVLVVEQVFEKKKRAAPVVKKRVEPVNKDLAEFLPAGNDAAVGMREEAQSVLAPALVPAPVPSVSGYDSAQVSSEFFSKLFPFLLLPEEDSVLPP